MAESLKATEAAEIWTLIHEQRRKLGDILETLSVHDWNTAALCEGWRVRDVVAHLIQTHLVTQRSIIADWRTGRV